MVIFPATIAVAWLGCHAVESSFPPPQMPQVVPTGETFADAGPWSVAGGPTVPDVRLTSLALPPQGDAAAPVGPVGGPDRPDPAPPGSAAAPVDRPVETPAAPSVRTIRLRVTAYCPCLKCCGRWSGKGLTASGAPITSNGGLFVAADTNLLPFKTRVRVPGYANGQWVPVLDRGGAIRGHRMEVFFHSHQVARQWGVQWLTVEVLQE